MVMNGAADYNEMNDCSDEITPISQYNVEEHKLKASLGWLMAKAYGTDIPEDLLHPLMKTDVGGFALRPTAVYALSSAQMYCAAAAVIFQDQSLAGTSHSQVLQALNRHQIPVNDLVPSITGEEQVVTETSLSQTAPLRMSCHFAMMDALMYASVRNSLSVDSVVNSIRRHVGDVSHVPANLDEAILLWINKLCSTMRDRLESQRDARLMRGDVLVVPEMEELYQEWYDFCCISTVIGFYRPQQLNIEEVHFNDPMSIGDVLANIALVSEFCNQQLPPPSLMHFVKEDILYTHQSMQPNILAFLTELFIALEGGSPQCTTPTSTPTAAKLRSSFQQQLRQSQQQPDLRSSKPSGAARVAQIKSLSKRGASGSMMNSVDSLATQRSIDSLKYCGVPQTEILAAQALNQPQQFGTFTRSTTTSFAELVDNGEQQSVESSAADSGVPSSNASMAGQHGQNAIRLELEQKRRLYEQKKKQLEALVQQQHEKRGKEAFFQAVKRDGAGEPDAASMSKSMYASLAPPVEQPKTNKQQRVQSVIAVPQEATTSQHQPRAGSHDGLQLEPLNKTLETLTSEIKRLSVEQTRLSEYMVRQQQQQHSPPVNNNMQQQQQQAMNLSGYNTLPGPYPSQPANPYLDNHNPYMQQSHTLNMPPQQQRAMQPQSHQRSTSQPRDVSPHQAVHYLVDYTNKPNVPGFHLHANQAKAIDESFQQQQQQQQQQHQQQYSQQMDPFMNNFGNITTFDAGARAAQLAAEQRVQQQQLLLATMQQQVAQNQQQLANYPSPPISLRRHASRDVFKTFDSRTPVNRPEVIPDVGGPMSPPQAVTPRQVATPPPAIVSRQVSRADSNHSQHSPIHAVPIQAVEIHTPVDTPDAITPVTSTFAGQRSAGVALDITFDDQIAATPKPVLPPHLRDRASRQAQGKPADAPSTPKQAQQRPVTAPAPVHTREASPGVAFKIDTEEVKDERELEMVRKREAFLNSAMRRQATQEKMQRDKADAVERKRQVEEEKKAEQERKKLEKEIHRQKIMEEYLKRKEEQAQAVKDGPGATPTMPKAPKPRVPSVRPQSQIVQGRVQTAPGGMSTSADGVDGQAASTSAPAEPDIKPFIKPSMKSNRAMIMNALQYSCLAGVVNDNARRKAAEEIAKSDAKHFLVLFRDTKCQYRGLYSWDQVSDSAYKLCGIGPKTASETMMHNMFKYDSGAKQFSPIPSRHLSATIDGFALEDKFWQKQKKAAAAPK